MNEDTLKGKWKQMKGEAKRQWGRLTEDDLARIEGDKDKLSGLLQERYGMEKEESRREADAFMNKHGA